jgi:DNA-binding FadR family transcriptional regulator
VRPIRLAFEQVADQLRQSIVRGELPAGIRLPSEPELAIQFVVSRSTIREALRMLASQQLITTSRGVGGGSYITHPEPEAISRVLHTNLGLLTGTRQIGVQQLLETRELLEVPAARLAALRHTDEAVARLDRLIPDNLDNLDDEHTFELNSSFHMAVLEASGNELLRLVTTPIFTFLQTRFLRERAGCNFWEQVFHDHALIAKAIAKGDARLAGREMERHLERLRPTYERMDPSLPA